MKLRKLATERNAFVPYFFKAFFLNSNFENLLKTKNEYLVVSKYYLKNNDIKRLTFGYKYFRFYGSFHKNNSNHSPTQNMNKFFVLLVVVFCLLGCFEARLLKSKTTKTSWTKTTGVNCPSACGSKGGISCTTSASGASVSVYGCCKGSQCSKTCTYLDISC